MSSLLQIFLASSGLGGLPGFINGDPHTLKLAFIPTAANLETNPWWIAKDRQILTDMGFQLIEVDLDKIQGPVLEEALAGVDVIFVAGGNSFYLLNAMQQSSLESIIYKHLTAGKQYVGTSAGAVVAGPDIAPVAGLDDANAAPTLVSTKGLGIVKFIVLPHYNDENHYEVDDILEKYGQQYSFKMITDQQAVIVSNDGIPTVVESR